MVIEHFMPINEDILIRILSVTAWRMEPPELFSWFHIIAAATTVLAAILLAKAASIHFRQNYLIISGWILAVLEIYKQLFLYYIAGSGSYDWWYFPFQLCSVPLYLCIALPLIHGKLRTAVLYFIADYTLIGAVAALIYPEDFLRSYVTLTVHGFVWHGILLFISLIIILSGECKPDPGSFIAATALFLMLSGAALVINIAAEPVMQAGNTAHSYAAMFYINPYHISPQLIVGRIQTQVGIPAGLLLYIAAIAGAAGIIEILRSRFGHPHSPGYRNDRRNHSRYA